MKSFRIPIFILLVTFLLSLYGGSSIRHYAQAWQAQLSLAESAVKRADWGQAQDILADLNDQWQEKQNRLHMLADLLTPRSSERWATSPSWWLSLCATSALSPHR